MRLHQLGGLFRKAHFRRSGAGPDLLGDEFRVDLNTDHDVFRTHLELQSAPCVHHEKTVNAFREAGRFRLDAYTYA